MNRKLTALLAAIVCALVGTLMLVGYVRTAEARALEGEELVSVLVVTSKIDAGTPGEQVGSSVKSEQIPAKVRADGAVTDVDDLEGLVATVDLVPGEQLVLDRFAEPTARPGVPEGKLEVTVRLDPERALGGLISAGDTVAVLASFDPFEVDASGTGGTATKTPNTTGLILHKIVVTNVQIATDAVRDEDDKTEPGEVNHVAPNGSMLVTLAMDADSVQRVVFAAEHGYLWLSAEPADASDADLPVVTLAGEYR
jgi:pilus assembly protein CpaB